MGVAVRAINLWTLRLAFRLVFLFLMLALTPQVSGVARADGAFALTSPAFSSGAAIPVQFSCSGSDQSPALNWTGAPEGTGSFALIVEDPDAPSGTFVHWVIFNLPGSSTGLPADVPKTPTLPDGAVQGKNGMGATGYKGPCPPPGKIHHYHFDLFALDTKVDAASNADADSLRSAMRGHIRGSTELVGTFSR